MTARRSIFLTLLLVVLASVVPALAQRRINPVNNAATATQPINENKERGDSVDRSRLVEMTDTKGNVVLVDTVTGKEFVDTFGVNNRQIPKMQQPLLYTASVSVDFFQPFMRAFGQHYGLIGFAAEVNLHNRYIPVFEFGLGQAKNTPEDNNYTYRSPISPYFRIGLDYNFFYNSNPDYLLFAGFRYGFSPFKFSVTDITLSNGYWEEDTRFDIPDQSVTAGYFEFLLGLRVRIFDRFSLGWTVRYHSLLHESKTDYGEAWYIPGFGSRNSSLGATFSLTYTIPLPNRPEAVTDNQLPLPDLESDGSDAVAGTDQSPDDNPSVEVADQLLGDDDSDESVDDQPVNDQSPSEE